MYNTLLMQTGCERPLQSRLAHCPSQHLAKDGTLATFFAVSLIGRSLHILAPMWAAHANMQTAKQSPWGVAQLVEARLVTQRTRRSQQQHAEHAAQVSLCSTLLYAQTI